MTGRVTAGYIKPDPPIEVGVTEYESGSARGAAPAQFIERVEKSIDRLDSIEPAKAMAGPAAEFPQ